MIPLLLACNDDPPVSPVPDTGPSCAVEAPAPRWDGEARVADVRLHGVWSLQVGWGVHLGTVDADRCEEILLGETRNLQVADIYQEEQPTERVTVLDAPMASGRAVDRGWRFAVSGHDSFDEDEDVYPFSLFGFALAVDAANDMMLVGAPTHRDYFDIASFALGTTGETQHIDDLSGTIRASRALEGPLTRCGLGTAELPGRHLLWACAFESVGPFALAGQVYLFDAPLIGSHDERDARATLRADGGDMVESTIGDADLDGDGVVDLVVGAHARNGVGEVAVISDPPDGEHRIWDLAVATYAGTVEGGHFGGQVAAGDLDGDGQAELLTGAPNVHGANTFHGFRGPAAGARHALDSDWTIVGEPGVGSLGFSSAAADLDGDGTVDLVVGRPGNPAVGDVAGEVLLFAGPVAPGVYDGGKADVVVRSERWPQVADAFGHLLRTGDLNGDTAEDLVISAPYDEEEGKPVGAVHVLYGRPDLFDGQP